MIQDLRSKEFNKRLIRLSSAEKQTIRKRTVKPDLLHVVYVMNVLEISGGVKIVLEHANRLQQMGVKVTIVSHFSKPNWFKVEVPVFKVPFGIDLAEGIPECDLIVATYWDHIQACIETGIAPVVYFEQGDYHLFDYENMNQVVKGYVQKQFEIPSFVFTVSNQAAQLVKEIYGRQAAVFPNAVDERIFTVKGEREERERPYILMVGGETSAFKGLPDIIKAYQIVKEEHQIDLFWITPEEPSQKMKTSVSECFVNPPQQKIAHLYRNAGLYVCGSEYENFPLPPLEAMSCGCPVITTNNNGSLEYCVHSENALICNINDPEDMAGKIKELLENEKLKADLIHNGLLTASRFRWEKIINDLHSYYLKIAENEVQPIHSLKEWDLSIVESDTIHTDGYQKLLKKLTTTTADLIQVPVVYELEGTPQIARWETVANRKECNENVIEKCFVPTKPLNSLQLFDLPGYRLFIKKQFERALDEFQTLFDQEKNEKEKAVYGKWIILCLIRLQRKHEAKTVLNKLLQQHPHFSDYYYLKTRLLEKGSKDEYSIAAMNLLGEGAAYQEFFVNIRN